MCPQILHLFFCRFQIFSIKIFLKESENLWGNNIQRDNSLPLEKGMNKVLKEIKINKPMIKIHSSNLVVCR